MNLSLISNRKFLEIVPSSNKEILSAMCTYFQALCNNTETTMMSPSNLGISIGPTLLLSLSLRENPEEFLENSKITGSLLAFIITHAETLFDWTKEK